jgi:hypothetical protein
VEARSISVEAIEMFNNCCPGSQIAGTIWALIVEALANQLLVSFAVDLKRPSLAYLAAQFMKEHAHEFIGNV